MIWLIVAFSTQSRLSFVGTSAWLPLRCPREVENIDEVAPHKLEGERRGKGDIVNLSIPDIIYVV